MRRLTPSTAKTIAQQAAGPAPYTLSAATLSDIEGILAIAQECFDYNVPTRREVRYFLTRAHAAFFLLKDANGRAVAYMLAEAHSGRQSLYINTIAVSPACRGQGLGQFFYGFGETVAKGLKARSVWSHVKDDNHVSIRLFEHQGYLKQRVETGYYDDGSSAFVYRKEFL